MLLEPSVHRDGRGFFLESYNKRRSYYSPRAEGVIGWNDPEIAIEWPRPNPIVSVRERAGRALRDYRQDPAFRFRGVVA